MRIFAVILLCAGTILGQGAGRVQFRDWKAPGATQKPKVACASLRALTSYDLSIVSATTIAASSPAPAHCRVSVFIQPALNIEVNLPAAWNGRFYMFGNGGFAGESFESASRASDRARGLSAGFAVASTDTGHSAATQPGGTFARNRQQLLDFAFRSLHLTAETAKMLIRAYYGGPPSKSYYEGCSQGGREGLIFAQRFPTDFDGIIAGSPGLDYNGTMLARAYHEQLLSTSPIPATKLKLLADTATAKCDAVDGLKDGLIDDPRRCDFHPATDLPRCAEGADSESCFTTADVTAIQRIYADVMSQGQRLFPGWPLGAESGWIGEVVNTADGRPGAWRTYTDGYLGFMAFPEGDPATAVAGFDVNRDPERVGWLRDIMDATDPDLTAFRAHNGKLILYYGWADPQLNPMMGVEYYQKVTERMGPSTADFARLFMVPGMAHCGGGVGTNVFDVATPLINWVESGTPPNRITASRALAGKVVRTRPLCPYPQVARYKGAGSIDDAASFSCVKP